MRSCSASSIRARCFKCLRTFFIPSSKISFLGARNQLDVSENSRYSFERSDEGIFFVCLEDVQNIEQENIFVLVTQFFCSNFGLLLIAFQKCRQHFRTDSTLQIDDYTGTYPSQNNGEDVIIMSGAVGDDDEIQYAGSSQHSRAATTRTFSLTTAEIAMTLSLD